MQRLLKIDFFCTGVKLIKPVNKSGNLIPEGMCNPGQVYTVSRGIRYDRRIQTGITDAARQREI